MRKVLRDLSDLRDPYTKGFISLNFVKNNSPNSIVSLNLYHHIRISVYIRNNNDYKTSNFDPTS
jgi:hypothetical protein